MKNLHLITIYFMLAHLSVFNLKGQEKSVIPAPNIPRLLADKDYANAEPAIIESAKWLKTTDLDKGKNKRYEIEAFVDKWIYGSSTYRKKAVYYKQLAYLTENNKDLFYVFHANYFRYYIESKENATHGNAIKAGLLSMLFVYNKGIETNKSVQLDQLSKINSSNQLDSYIKKYFTIKQGEFGSIIALEKEIPDESAPSLSELKERDRRQNQRSSQEDPDGVPIRQPKSPNKKPAAEPILTSAEVMPKFDGDINNYLEQNIKYPPIALANQIEGQVMVQFVIDKDGVIDQSSVVVYGKKLGWGLEEEAIRVVSNMPRWIPAKQKGKAVKIRYSLAVPFKVKE